MPGQYKTRRNPKTGQIESVPEAEQGALKAAAEGIKPPTQAVRQQDVDFVNAAEPPPLPDATEPPPLPPRAPPVQPPPPPADEDGGGGGSVAGAAGNVAAASLRGPIAAGAAAVTAGATWVAGQSLKQTPVGSLDGGKGQMGAGDQEVLRQLLAVQRGIARVGAPIKDLVTTNPNGSRM